MQPLKSRNVAFGTPKNNEIVPHKNNENVPQPLRNVSHHAKCKKAASGAHPKRQSPSRFCVQAIAGVQPQKSRNVAFGTPKNNEIVPQPLRNFSHQAKPKKAASGAHLKRQSPSRFCVQAIAELQPQKSRNVAFGTPIKKMKSCPSHCETAATRQSPRKLRRERIRKGRAPAGFASKPLQECSLKNLETLLSEPLNTMKSSPIKTMKTCLSHCFAFGTPKNTQAIRKHSQKNADALLLEPTKKNKESIPKPLRNFSHQAKPKKKVSDLRNQRRTTNSGTKTLRRERIRKGRAPAGFASKPLQECSLNENVPQPLRGSATRQSVRKLRRERIRKGRAPASFASKPLQECNLKNLETLLLEPLKTMKSCPIKTMKTCLSHCETSATRQSLRKLRRAEPQQVLRPSHCRSAASKISKRCVWNP